MNVETLTSRPKSAFSKERDNMANLIMVNF